MNKQSENARKGYAQLPRHTVAHKGTPCLLPTILHADSSNRPRTAFQRCTHAVHQVAAIQVDRHRFWRALTASWRQKGKRKLVFPRAIRTTELPSNPSPLTFRNNQIQILQTSSTHATMAANVSQQVTNTHDTWLSHARTYNARQRDKSPDSPAKPTRSGGEINVVLQQQRIVRVVLPLGQLGLESSVT